jgi:hypothetical protein
MALKEFARDDRGYVFMSDARDIATPYSKRQEVYEWAGENSITIEYQGTLGGFDVWRVLNDQDRAWFNLRWA